MPVIIERMTSKEIQPGIYRVRVNGKVICLFNHEYEEGLAACLYKAAEAVADTEPCHTRSKR